MTFANLPFFVPDQLTIILIWAVILLIVWVLSLEKRIKKQRGVIEKVSQLERVILPLLADQDKKSHNKSKEDLKTVLHQLSQDK